MSPDAQVLQRQRLVLHAAVDHAEPARLHADVGGETRGLCGVLILHSQQNGCVVACLALVIRLAAHEVVVLVTVGAELLDGGGVVVKSDGVDAG